MTARMTRRTAAKLLASATASASAALALPRVAESAPAEKKTAKPSPALTPAERKLRDKSVAQIRAAAEKLRKHPVPIGTEPAFVFRPLPPSS